MMFCFLIEIWCTIYVAKHDFHLETFFFSHYILAYNHYASLSLSVCLNKTMTNKCADALIRMNCILDFNIVFFRLVRVVLKIYFLLMLWGSAPLVWLSCSLFLLGLVPLWYKKKHTLSRWYKKKKMKQHNIFLTSIFVTRLFLKNKCFRKSLEQLKLSIWESDDDSF
jgi:hypothetical protein